MEQIRQKIANFLAQNEKDVHVANLQASYLLNVDEENSAISVWAYKKQHYSLTFIGGDEYFEQFCKEYGLAMLATENRWKEGDVLSNFVKMNPGFESDLLFLHLTNNTEDEYSFQVLCHLPLAKDTAFIKNLKEIIPGKEEEENYSDTSVLAKLNEWIKRNWTKQVA